MKFPVVLMIYPVFWIKPGILVNCEENGRRDTCCCQPATRAGAMMEYRGCRR